MSLRITIPIAPDAAGSRQLNQNANPMNWPPKTRPRRFHDSGRVTCPQR
jgi:hypothetical protein